MKRALLLIIAALLLASVGCQPTPEVEPVPNKADGVAESIIRDQSESHNEEFIRQDPTAAPAEASGKQDPTTAPAESSLREQLAKHADEPYILEERWVDVIETPDWTVPIDAAIVTSGQETFPVRVVQRKEFSVSEAEQLANLFFPNVTAVVDGYRVTAADYELAIQNRLDLNMTEFAKEKMQEMQESKAEEHVYQEASTISFDTIPHEMRVQTNEKDGYVYVTTDNIYLEVSVSGVVHWKELVEEEGSFDGDTPKLVQPKNTSEEAQQAAEEFLAKAGIEGFSAVASHASRFFDIFLKQEISIGWSFSFVKAYEYCPFDPEYAVLQSNILRETALSKPWNCEQITIYVSEKGEVEQFDWIYPTEVLYMANENVQLLPLNELEPMIKRMITYALPPVQTYQGRPLKFGYAMKVTEIFLSTTLQELKDDPGKAYVMPTWVCHVEVFDLNLKTNQIREPSAFSKYYGTNAIDGTYLRLRTG